MQQRGAPPLGAIRRGLGLSQAELGRRAGYKQSTISRIETGDLRPWGEFRRRVADVFAAPEDVVFGRDP